MQYLIMKYLPNHVLDLENWHWSISPENDPDAWGLPGHD